jgi:hypothetical protein
MLRVTVASSGAWISTDMSWCRMLQQGDHPMDLQLLEKL